MPRILYISYTGMTDSLGESQVLSYALGLAKIGHSIDIISAEKPDLYKKNYKRVNEKISETSVSWIPIQYHKKPPILSTLLDYLSLRKEARKLIDHHNYDFIHCRGYIPALLGSWLKSKYRLPFIFDMRGFWPDEKMESGNWANPIYRPIYTFFKQKEKELFAHADLVISLTYAGKEEIIKQGWVTTDKIGVIPTCVDFASFPEFNQQTRQQTRKTIGVSPETKVLIYSGSLGGNYDVRIPFKVFQGLKKVFKNSHFLILSRSNPAIVHQFIEENSLDEKEFTVISIPFDKVHQYLMAGDLGLIFYGPGYSNKGRSPTKLGEYWASDLPAIALKNIGDVDKIIGKYSKSGIIIPDLREQSIIDAINRFVKGNKGVDLRAYAKDYYSLKKGVDFYDKQYQKILSIVDV